MLSVCSVCLPYSPKCDAHTHMRPNSGRRHEETHEEALPPSWASTTPHFIFGQPPPKTHLPPLDTQRPSRSRPSSGRPASARPGSARPGSAGEDLEGAPSLIQVKTHWRRRLLLLLVLFGAVVGGLTPTAIQLYDNATRTPSVDSRAVHVEAALQWTSGLSVSCGQTLARFSRGASPGSPSSTSHRRVRLSRELETTRWGSCCVRSWRS